MLVVHQDFNLRFKWSESMLVIPLLINPIYLEINVSYKDKTIFLYTLVFAF